MPCPCDAETASISPSPSSKNSENLRTFQSSRPCWLPARLAFQAFAFWRCHSSGTDAGTGIDHEKSPHRTRLQPGASVRPFQMPVTASGLKPPVSMTMYPWGPDRSFCYRNDDHASDRYSRPHCIPRLGQPVKKRVDLPTSRWAN
jgi:hypothetical protein